MINSKYAREKAEAMWIKKEEYDRKIEENKIEWEKKVSAQIEYVSSIKKQLLYDFINQPDAFVDYVLQLRITLDNMTTKFDALSTKFDALSTKFDG